MATASQAKGWAELDERGEEEEAPAAKQQLAQRYPVRVLACVLGSVLVATSAIFLWHAGTASPAMPPAVSP